MVMIMNDVCGGEILNGFFSGFSHGHFTTHCRMMKRTREEASGRITAGVVVVG